MAVQITDENSYNFYSNAVQYWADVPATLDGMLGGFGYISQTDVRGSKILLKQLFNSISPPGKVYALDCGAGIGRVSKHLLSDFFEKIDLVEQSPTFLDQARKYLGPKLIDKVGEFFSVGLQDFVPENGKYDVIWVQWVMGHLTNTDVIKFLKNCQIGLKENGVIVIKENTTSSDEIDMDKNDSSVTRPLALLRKLFIEADLECYRQVLQNNFPKGLYSVYMFVLKPISNNTNVEIESKDEAKNTYKENESNNDIISTVLGENSIDQAG